MIQVIIFDCFGVLTTDGWLPFKQQHFEGNDALWREASDLNKQVDSGLISYEDFASRIGELAGVSAEEVLEAIESNVANERLFEYIRDELAPHYKLGILSNAGANWLDKLFSPEQLQLFSVTALSYQTGFIKPDPRAYQVILDKLNATPEECLFIDDQERYCTAAKEMGFQAVVYASVNQLRSDLEQILSK